MEKNEFENLKENDREVLVCPYCEQGVILKVKLKKNNKVFLLCDECDAAWTEEVSDHTGTRFDIFMKSEGYKNSWDEIEIIERVYVPKKDK